MFLLIYSFFITIFLIIMIISIIFKNDIYAISTHLIFDLLFKDNESKNMIFLINQK